MGSSKMDKNKEKLRIKEMQGGEDERAKIMASAIQHEEGATISCVV